MTRQHLLPCRSFAHTTLKKSFLASTKVAAWFELINTGILLLWTLEFLVKAVAYGMRKYFMMAKIDCLVIPFLYAADAHAMINVFAPPNVAEHFDFLSFVAGFQFLRVLRCTRLLARVKRLKSLFATVELSLTQARNILIIIALAVFIFGVVGMKLFGDVCSNPDADMNDSESTCSVINVRGSFRTITGSMRFLFEIMTNEDSSPLMRDLNSFGDSSKATVSLYFGVFYILSNFILLNLLGAPHSHFLPCHSFSHTILKSPCAEQSRPSSRITSLAWSVSLHFRLSHSFPHTNLKVLVRSRPQTSSI